MNSGVAQTGMGFCGRILAVWNRHMRVYGRNLVSNGLPPFLEPLIFLGGIGLGFRGYVGMIEGMPYLRFLGTGLLVTTAMFTAAYECTYVTFIRLEFEKVYDGMLAAPLTVRDLFLGEILWAGSKGLFFSFAVLLVLSLCGIVSFWAALAAPLIGFVTAVMFGAVGLLVTSFVKTINHFSFFFTGLMSPMFFFCGVVFSIAKLPGWIRPVVELLPLTHPVRLMRAIVQGQYGVILLWDGVYIVLLTLLAGTWAIRRLRRRLIT